ncbi:hypothetical protein HMPREF1624_00974 [Sporothrix schenckii ATCC 58251]|uniref:tRNA (guanine(9)-N1)-methyltransferase n=1 Tax=Sporothrix schenckii (strain ATCC 58251 / de Perez 2211183) TaxID=1391915 RepID=U7Q493_SPOS1|nr:hypothetical protein HMPREF1624_00974 [Sporothrix schenckii ATCC 58251]
MDIKEPPAPGLFPSEGGPVQATALQLASENGDAQLPGQNNMVDTSRLTELASAGDTENGGEDGTGPAAEGARTALAASGAPGTLETPGTLLSKNAQKKLKRQQKWEDMRDDRKRRRKEKRVIKAEKKKAAKAAGGEGADGCAAAPATAAPKEHTLVPVSLIFDCAFESYMRETEQISLSSQITRSYAANRTAARCARIYVSSWGGKLQTRYETLLANQHKRWNHVHFLADDFVAAAKQADMDMRGENGGTVVDVLEAKEGDEALKRDDERGEKEAGKTAEEKEADEEITPSDGPSVVYLTSDSPYTLTRLEPNTSYVIGGIVDKNREKGLCYKRAREHGVRTAKLPIGDYMVMASRKVLTTNHVVEIMLSWLETGDWATAFSNVIPKRKGGHLKGEKGDTSEKSAEEGDAGAEEEQGEDGNDEEAEEGEAKEADDSEMGMQDNSAAAEPQATEATESVA